MKKTPIIILLFLITSLLSAQNIAFHENFEAPSFADSVVSTQTVPGTDDWVVSHVLSTDGQYSDSCSVLPIATSYLTTDTFSTLGKFIVHLDFDQICKVDFLDPATIEISVDSGGTWTTLTGNEYLGGAFNFAALGWFNSSSYGNDWFPGDASASPDNTWWKHEKFDISALASDEASVLIRFKLPDGGTIGANGNYGWLLDEIIVRASVSELDPPIINMIPPVYLGNVYNLGPFEVKAEITDSTGIDTAYVVYNVNSGINDTIGMTVLLADTFIASMPVVNHLDTICYHVVAIDASLSYNMAKEPVNSCNEFVASAGIIIPYYNSLDWPGSLNDFLITNTTYGRIHQNVAAANTGAGGMIMDASAQTDWTTTLPDTANPGANNYVWNVNINPTHYANARLVLFSQGYTALFLKFDLKQIFGLNNLYTHFRVVVNGTMITPHYTPKGSTTQYITYEFDLTQFLPATSLIIDFESKVRYPFDGTTANGNFIDNILVDVPPQQEAKLVEITAPVGACGLSNEAVTIKIKNKGTDPIIGNMTGSYFLLGSSTTVTEPINLAILPGGIMDFTFNTLVDLSVIGADSTFELISYINLVGDPYTNNDTAYTSVTSSHVPVDPIVTNANIPYGSFTTLTAVSNDSLFWYDIPAGGVEIGTGPSYTTPVLYDTTIYYVEAKSGGGVGIIITEAGLGGTDFLEIQNVSNSPVDANGWIVAISNSYTDINLVNTIVWNLSNMLAGEVQYREDLTGNNYWGNNMFWNQTSPGWIIIIDDNGEVVDFVAWGWTDSEIQSFSTNINGYNITIGSEWIGDGIMAFSSEFLERITYDNDDASDYINVTVNTKGQPNPNLVGTGGTANGCPSNRIPDTVFVGSIPPYDASMVSIYTPNTDFNLTPFETVTVKIKNYGTMPISGFPVSYIINGGTPVTETINSTIIPGDTLIHIFNATADLSVFGIYDFKAYLTVPNDLNQINDTAYKTVENKILVYCPSNATSALYDDIGNITLSTLDNGIATPVVSNPNATGTYTDFTNLPPAQITKGNIHAISISQITSTTTIQPCYVEVYIDYNRDGVFTEPTEIAFGALTSASLTTVTGNINVPLTAVTGLTVMRVVMERTTLATNVFPCGTYTYGETEDYLVMISPPIPKDAGVINILQPTALEFEGASVPVEVTVRNFGTDTIFAMDVAYRINGGAPVIDTWAGALLPAATTDIILTDFIVPPLNNEICAYTMLIGDSNLLNNQSCKDFYGYPKYNPEAVSISSPLSGCGLGMETVTLEIYNEGHDTIKSGLSASYYLLGGSNIITEQVNIHIPPADTASFSFVTTVDLSVTTVDSTFEIIAYVDMPTDWIKDNDTTNKKVFSAHIPPDPIVTNVTIPYATSTTITATSIDSLFWYDVPVGGLEVGTGASYTTPVLFGTTVYYVQAGGTGLSSGDSLITTYAGGNGHRGAMFDITATNTITITSFDVNLDNNTTPKMEVYYKTGSYVGFGTDPGPWTLLGSHDVIFNAGDGNPTPLPIGGLTINAGETYGIYLTSANTTTSINYSNIPPALTTYMDPNIVVNGGIAGEYPFNCTIAARMFNGTIHYILGSSSNGCPSNRVPDTVFVAAVPPYDISVVEIQSPVSDFLLTNSEPVTIKVKNYGNLPVTGFPVSYKLDNGIPVTDTIYATLDQGDTIIHTFSKNVNLAAFGIYNIKAYLSYPGDLTLQNDTAYASVENKIFVYCLSHATSASYEDIGNVTISNLNNGYPIPVTSNPTAINGYTDFTNLPPVQLAPGVTYPISISLISASTSLTACDVKVYIDYNRDGIFDPVAENAYSGVTSSTVTTISGNITVPFSAEDGITMMRVVLDRNTAALPCGTYSYGETEDYLVMMAPLIPQDAGVTTIVNPGILDDAGNSVPIDVIIQNFGTDPITSMEIAYEVNGGTPIIINYNNTLAPSQTDNVTLPNYTIQAGDNFICAYTILANDSNTFNDAKCNLTYGQFTTTPPYYDNFDSPVSLWWNDSVPNAWERGVPNGVVINYPHSSPNVWITDLDEPYVSNKVSFLYTPKFSVLSAIGVDSLKFWHFVHTQPGDGGNVQYLSTTGWRILGMQNDPNAINWYNSPTNMWTLNGIGPGWKYSAYDLKSINDFAAITQFRFVFYANNSGNTTHDGWAIDDFKIIIPKIPEDGGVISIIDPTNPITKGTQFGVKVKIQNFGTDTLYSIPIYYKINNGLNINGTWNGNLFPDSTAEYTFPTIPAPWNDFNFCAYTALAFDTYLYNDGYCENIIVNPPQMDAGIQSIVYPTYQTLFGIDTTISVWVKNYGIDTIKSCDLEYSAAGVVQATETWTGSLAAGDSIQYTFINKFNHTFVGYYYMQIYTKLASDGFSPNDTIKVILESFFNDILESELDGFTLSQNFPNPTSGNTIIKYSVPSSGEIRFVLVNYLGQMMLSKAENVMAGEHQIEINVNDLPSGLYFYFVEFDGYRLVKKMIVNK